MVAMVVLALAASGARAALDVAWDCYLPSGQVGCSTLEAAVFSNGAYARALDEATQEASLSVRAAPAAGGVAYTVHPREQHAHVFPASRACLRRVALSAC